MKILVTGGAGYIGSFMVKRLISRGDKVHVIDSLERGHKDAIDSEAIFHQMNLMDWDEVEQVFSSSQFDAVIHFAGYISMEESARDPGLYFCNNTSGSLEIIEHCKRNNVKNFIFSSTAGVYGNPIKIPIPEDHPTNPVNPYGESKLMVEKILSWFNKIDGLSYACLRYFNASGAAIDGSMGEAHDPETHIIPKAIEAALNNNEFKMFGTDYQTQDGTCVRDYIHVLDLVEAHILALEKLVKDKGGYIYNVGTGKGYSNKEVVEMVKKISGINFPIVELERRSGDADSLVADSSKIRNELGFNPKYSDLETIVKTAWEYHSKNSK
ncbi:MAG: UDP-glucose 4-epimerase GalE [Candidatus Levybacteria bacterium CG_4_10_14_0_2_um_filter_36_16]|nr:MAG: UDP-glucose 4-epimerase GalE [Candidatus Levybacteria bacterium CG2_30_37_29]PIZ98024.1 MAG: UDP-glucose 4-epimerase GalE [Candidatus Levybacteria bacterium CG_4_10_14_0_2_um_filter_36_16]